MLKSGSRDDKAITKERGDKGPVAKVNHENVNQEGSRRIENLMHARIGMQGTLYSHFHFCAEEENKKCPVAFTKDFLSRPFFFVAVPELA